MWPRRPRLRGLVGLRVSEVTEREALNILRKQLQGGGVQVEIHQIGGPR